MRGDRPQVEDVVKAMQGFTPHARGSTPGVSSGIRPPGVYPACAGIDLEQQRKLKESVGLPRMRGDRP